MLHNLLIASIAFVLFADGGSCGGSRYGNESPCSLGVTRDREAFGSGDAGALDWCADHGCISREAALCLVRHEAVADEVEIGSESAGLRPGPFRRTEGDAPAVWHVERSGTAAHGEPWIQLVDIDARDGRMMMNKQYTIR